MKSSWKKILQSVVFCNRQNCMNYMKEDHRNYMRNLCSCEKKAWKKKFRLVWDSKPWPLRYRCSALPIKLTSQLGAGRHIWSNRRNIKIRTPSHHQVRQIRFADWEDFDQLYVKIDSFHQHPSKQRCVKIVLNHGNQATKDLKYKTAFQVFFFTTLIKLLFSY